MKTKKTPTKKKPMPAGARYAIQNAQRIDTLDDRLKETRADINEIDEQIDKIEKGIATRFDAVAEKLTQHDALHTRPTLAVAADAQQALSNIRGRVDGLENQVKRIYEREEARTAKTEDTHTFKAFTKQKLDENGARLDRHAGQIHRHEAALDLARQCIEKLEGGKAEVTAVADAIQDTERLRALVVTLSHEMLALTQRVAMLEGEREITRPMWTRLDGKKVAIADMNDHHLRNAILRVLRNEYVMDAERIHAFKDLCTEADKRSMDWKSWTKDTEPTRRSEETT